MDVPTQLERKLQTSGITPELVFQLPPDSTTVVSRKTVKLSPSSGGGDEIHGDGASTLRWKIRGGDFIDTESMYCSVKYKQNGANHGAVHYIEPPNGCECLIKELRLRSGAGGAAIETIVDSGLLSSILIDYSHSKSHIQTIHTIAGGGRGIHKNLENGKYDPTATLPTSKVLPVVAYPMINDRMGGVVN